MIKKKEGRKGGKERKRKRKKEVKTEQNRLKPWRKSAGSVNKTSADVISGKDWSRNSIISQGHSFFHFSALPVGWLPRWAQASCQQVPGLPHPHGEGSRNIFASAFLAVPEISPWLDWFGSCDHFWPIISGQRTLTSPTLGVHNQLLVEPKGNEELLKGGKFRKANNKCLL